MAQNPPLPVVNHDEPHFSFFNAAARVRWGYYHLRHLRGELDKWFSLSQSSISSGPTKSGVEITISAAEMQYWPIYAVSADIVHNLRSALDYCWMGLLRGAADGPYDGKETYPVGGSREWIMKKVAKLNLGDFRDRALKIVLDDVTVLKDDVRDVQSPLSILTDLNNWQKHNALPIMVGDTTIPRITFFGGGFPDVVIRDTKVPFGGSVTVKSPFRSPHYRFDGVVRHEVRLDGFPPLDDMPLVEALIYLADETKRFVKIFFTAFPEAVWFRPDRVFGPGMAGHNDQSFGYI